MIIGILWTSVLYTLVNLSDVRFNQGHRMLFGFEMTLSFVTKFVMWRFYVFKMARIPLTVALSIQKRRINWFKSIEVQISGDFDSFTRYKVFTMKIRSLKNQSLWWWNQGCSYENVCFSTDLGYFSSGVPRVGCTIL